METAPTPRPYPDHPYWGLLQDKENILHLIAEYEELARNIAFRYDKISDPRQQAAIKQELNQKQQVIASYTDQLSRIELDMHDTAFELARLLAKDRLR